METLKSAPTLSRFSFALLLLVEICDFSLQSNSFKRQCSYYTLFEISD